MQRQFFFEKSHLPLWKILCLTYAWSLNCGTSHGLSVKSIMREFQIGSNKTVVDWMQFARDVTVAHFDHNHQPLGGPGCIVEIDESIVARNKANVGSMVPEQWVFGGCNPAT